MPLMAPDHAGAGAEGIDWDVRYSAAEQVWSGNPNGVLVAEISDVTPGTAVDVGCGEGADAIWLAHREWDVTAFDVSAVALARAAEHVEKAGIRVQLLHGGLLDLPAAQFDLVNVQYPALLHEQGRSLAGLLALVAPGGTLLSVHHDQSDPDHARQAGFDPADYVMPADVHAALARMPDAWQVQVYGDRPRNVATGAGAGPSVDVVLRARRTNSAA